MAIADSLRSQANTLGQAISNGNDALGILQTADKAMNRKKWAKVVIKITDFFQKDHCKRANKREQPVVDFILSRNLDKQTIGKR